MLSVMNLKVDLITKIKKNRKTINYQELQTILKHKNLVVK